MFRLFSNQHLFHSLQRNYFSTLPELLARSVERHGSKNLFGTRKDASSPYEWMTYDQFFREVNRFKSLLQAKGLKEGEPLAVLSNNGPGWAIAAYAGFSLGLPIVPMYESQRPKEWEYIIRNSGAAALVSSRVAHLDHISEMHRHYVATKPAAPAQPPLDPAARASSSSSPAQPPAASHHQHHRRRHAHRNHTNEDPTKTMPIFAMDLPADDPRSFHQSSPAPPPSAPSFSPVSSDLACIIYTSGTTALPKGVMLSHDNIVSNVQALDARIGEAYEEGKERHLSFLPWAHVYGQTVELHFAIRKGSSVALAQRTETLLGDLMEAKPTILVSVPQVFYKINDRISARLQKMGRMKQLLFQAALGIARQRREALNSPSGQLSVLLQCRWALAQKIFANIKTTFGGRLKYAITGGGALSLDIQHFFADIGIPVIEGYGLTETAPIIACEKYGPTEHLQGGLQALPGVKISLYEPGTTRRLTQPDEEGEICVVGRLVMMGYHDNEAATNEVIFTTAEGERCFRTGDLGKLSASGVLSITGRCKEQYKLTNGKYVMPSKLEQFTLRSRYVEQIYVHGANMPYNVALVYPDLVDLRQDFPELKSETVAQLLEQHGDRVKRIILDDLDNILAHEMHTAGYEKIRAIHLLSEPFSIQNNTLTQKLSMKRRVITELYHQELKNMYPDKKEPMN